MYNAVFNPQNSSWERWTGAIKEPYLTGDVATGNLAASGNTVVCPLNGYNGAAIQLSGTYSLTVAFEASYDGGTNYVAVNASPPGGSSVLTSTTPTANSLNVWEVSVPGATHIRVRCSAWTSGTGVIRINPVVMAFEGAPAVTFTSTQNVAVSNGALYVDETGISATLALSTTANGSTRDTATASGTSSLYTRFAALATGDQAFTMRLEFSRDGTTWRRASPDAAVAAGDRGLIEGPVVARYNRVVIINGGVAQTTLIAQTAYYRN